LIFLSHNHHDKDVVGPIAVHLSTRYGKDDVFYDSWTMRPGDSVIGKMSEGLSRCKFFFYFISENSLKSEMVNLEWQPALFKAAKEGIKFVPIKVDDSNQPAILIDKFYINMYEDGMDTTITRIVDVIENRDSSIYNATFNNITSKIEKETESTYLVTVLAKKFIERDAVILFSFSNPLEEIDIKITSDGTKTIHASSGEIGEDFFKSIFLRTRPLTPKKPIVYKISNKNSTSIINLRVWHQTDDDKATLIGKAE